MKKIISKISELMIFIEHEDANCMSIELGASEPKWVNPVFNIIEVNSLKLGGLQLFFENSKNINLIKKILNINKTSNFC